MPLFKISFMGSKVLLFGTIYTLCIYNQFTPVEKLVGKANGYFEIASPVAGKVDDQVPDVIVLKFLHRFGEFVHRGHGETVDLNIPDILTHLIAGINTENRDPVPGDLKIDCGGYIPSQHRNRNF